MALTGKVAVVTGAAQGLGRGITEILLENGAKVALLDMCTTAGNSLKESLDKQYGKERTLFLSCDVTSEEQFKASFQKTIETFGGVDIMCNNAGILDENLVDKMVSINLLGVIKGTYMALAHMNKLTGGRGGVVINTASTSGLDPVQLCPVYSATKYGVIGFTRAMAAASADSGYGIRFNILCPGVVRTNMLATILQSLGQLGEQTQKFVDMFGVMEVSEVAKSLLELVTDETKNGETLMVLPQGSQYITFPNMTNSLQKTTTALL